MSIHRKAMFNACNYSSVWGLPLPAGSGRISYPENLGRYQEESGGIVDIKAP